MLGTRLQKFGVFKPPYSAPGRDIQDDSLENIFAVIAKHRGITVQMANDKLKFGSDKHSFDI